MLVCLHYTHYPLLPDVAMQSSPRFRVFAALLQSLVVAAGSCLAVRPASADPAHFWRYQENGRYGYVQSTYVNACAGQTWQSCKQPISWYAYRGTMKLSQLQVSNPPLAHYVAAQFGIRSTSNFDPYLAMVSVSPDPDHLLFGQGALARHDWLIYFATVDPLTLRLPASKVLVLHVAADGTLSGREHDVERGSPAALAFQDLELGQLQVSTPTASDQAQEDAAQQLAKDHPAPVHWWMYAVNGRYGYVQDPADPTCTPDWRQCKKPITWLMYDGQKSNGEQVFTLFDSPTRLKVISGQASAMQLSERDNGQASVSYLGTDGSETSQDLTVGARSPGWFAQQDAAHGQLTPSQLTASEQAPLQTAARKFQKSRGVLAGKMLQSWINKPRVEIENGQ